jgi:small-conductance mechanosensitive channel
VKKELEILMSNLNRITITPRRNASLLWRVLCLVLCCAALYSPVDSPVARAQNITTPGAATTSAPAAQSEATLPVASVQLNGRLLFDVIGSDEADALHRADRINRRLQLLVEREAEVERFQPTDVVKTSAGLTIMLGGAEITTVTQADVENELTPAPELAQRWGTKMSRAVRTARVARSGTLSNIGVLTATALFDLVRSVSVWLPRLLGALVLGVLFWILARLMRWLTMRATYSKRLDPNLRQLAVAVAFYGTWTLGIIGILSTLGINSTSIATTVGISGFILGFAFKDVLSHFLAGMMLLVGRQFSIGGQIVVGEFEGTVESIDLRALHLRTYDNRLVTIPNGDVFNSAVIANSRNLYRRREFTVGIGYEDDARRAIELALETVRGVDGVLDTPPPEVVAVGLGASSIDLRILFHTSTLRTDSLAIVSECILRVKERFDAEGITIPFTTHTIDVRHASEVVQALQPLTQSLHPDEEAQLKSSRNGHPAEKAIA